ncbi:MAG: BlaI/MecI/CopY family transcriptional regulator [Gemmatimonadota bacterium]
MLDIQFTDRQLDIMNILWDRGSATVREAKDEIEEDLAYTSVLTVFQTLEEKGHVRHEREGKAYRYYPTVARDEAGRNAVDYILDRIFRNSPSALVTSLVEQRDVSEEEARELTAVIESRREAGTASG